MGAPTPSDPRRTVLCQKSHTDTPSHSHNHRIAATCGTHNALLTPAAQWKHTAGRHRLGYTASSSHFLLTGDIHTRNLKPRERRRRGVTCARAPALCSPTHHPRTTSGPSRGSASSIPKITFQICPLEETSVFLSHLALLRGGMASYHALMFGRSHAPRVQGFPGPSDPTDDEILPLTLILTLILVAMYTVVSRG